MEVEDGDVIVFSRERICKPPFFLFHNGYFSISSLFFSRISNTWFSFMRSLSYSLYSYSNGISLIEI